jgi:hypothetical protein
VFLGCREQNRVVGLEPTRMPFTVLVEVNHRNRLASRRVGVGVVSGQWSEVVIGPGVLARSSSVESLCEASSPILDDLRLVSCFGFGLDDSTIASRTVVIACG